MQPHVQQTLTDIDTRIVGLQTFRAQLLTFFNETPPPENASLIPIRPANPKPTRSSPVFAGSVDPRSITSLTVLAAIPEPFDMKALESAGLKKGTLHRYFARGWLKRLSPGQFARSSKFPKLNGAERGTSRPAATPKPIKRSPLSQAVLTEANNSDLEKKLADACKQRDQARSAGRETIVEMFQKEIDDLQAQIDAQ